jgi:hypothetical protein
MALRKRSPRPALIGARRIIQGGGGSGAQLSGRNVWGNVQIIATGSHLRLPTSSTPDDPADPNSYDGWLFISGDDETFGAGDLADAVVGITYNNASASTARPQVRWQIENGYFAGGSFGANVRYVENYMQVNLLDEPGGTMNGYRPITGVVYYDQTDGTVVQSAMNVQGSLSIGDLAGNPAAVSIDAVLGTALFKTSFKVTDHPIRATNIGSTGTLFGGGFGGNDDGAFKVFTDTDGQTAIMLGGSSSPKITTDANHSLLLAPDQELWLSSRNGASASIQFRLAAAAAWYLYTGTSNYMLSVWSTTLGDVMQWNVNSGVPYLFYGVNVAGSVVHNTLFASATIDFPNTAANSESAESTITVTGAVDGDCVMVGWTNAANVAGGFVKARVSAANTVKVAFVNSTAGALNPGSGTISVWVIR